MRALEQSPGDSTSDWADIRLLPHLYRAISHISHLISSYTGASKSKDGLASSSRSSVLQSSGANSQENVRTKLRVCGSILRRILLLGNSRPPSERGETDAGTIVAQVADEIIIPLIGHFDLLSRRYAEQAFRISLDEANDELTLIDVATDLQGSLEPTIDLREDCSWILVQLLDPFTQPIKQTPTESSSNTRRNSSSVFIPLSGTTAASTESDETPSPSDAARLWFGDIILYLAAVEVSRLGCMSSTNLGDSSGSDSLPLLQQRERSVRKGQRDEILRITREETIWHLCSVIHACIHARQRLSPSFGNSPPPKPPARQPPPSDVQSSEAVVHGAMEVLMQPLLLDQATQRRRREYSYDSDDCYADAMMGLGLVERGLIIAAVDALNDSCEAPWEVDCEAEAPS